MSLQDWAKAGGKQIPRRVETEERHGVETFVAKFLREDAADRFENFFIYRASAVD